MEQVHLRLINWSVHPNYPRNSFLLRGTVLLKIKLTFWSVELFIHLDLFGVSCPILEIPAFRCNKTLRHPAYGDQGTKKYDWMTPQQ